MNSILASTRLLALALFTGGAAAVAFIVAPVAFHTLETRELAGRVVGRCLHAFEFAALATLGVALASSLGLRIRRAGSIVAEATLAGLLVATLVLKLWVAPSLEEARPQGTGAGTRFQKLHKAYEGVFGVQILAGAALVVLLRGTPKERGGG